MVYGIDLGTTYSCIAKCDDNGLVEVIRDRLYPAEAVTPSVISFDENGKPAVGVGAKNNLGSPERAERVVTHVKRYMGDDFCPDLYKIGNESRKISPVEGSAIILHHLLKNANNEQYARGEEPIVDAVITIPAGFNNKQRECTKIAAELAGINVLGLIHEPTAAAISSTTKDGDTVLVFDLGGGTLDVSIVKCSRRNGRLCYETLGVSSDMEVHGRYLGGKDWDDETLYYALQEIGVDIDAMSRPARDEMLIKTESCKKSLTGDLSASLDIGIQHTNVSIRRTTFENITIELLEKCVDVVKKAIEKAEENVGASELNIDRFLLVGGSSNMPMIRTRLSQEFEERFGKGRNRNQWIIVTDPEMAIAKGAAKYAHALTQGDVEEGNIIVDTELSQFSYGTSIIDDDGEMNLQNLILSTDNMVVESRDFSFATKSEGQSRVMVDVYENRSTEVVIPLDKSHNKIYDQTYQFDYPVPKGTSVDFNVSRNKDGIISIRVSSPGHHEENHPISTIHPPVTDEVRQQIIHSIQMMDQD